MSAIRAIRTIRAIGAIRIRRGAGRRRGTTGSISALSAGVVTGILISGLTGGLAGCAGGRDIAAGAFAPFPPHRLRPISLAVTAPLQPVDFGPLHQSLQAWSGSGAERRRLVSCAWQTGAAGLTALAVPGTEIACFAFGRNPLPPTADWVAAATDTLGRTQLRLAGGAAVAQARHRGWTHLVVPRALDYGAPVGDADGDGDGPDAELGLKALVAIVDVLEGAIVWQGRVDGRPWHRRELLARQEDAQPPLTPYERATYAWLLALFDTLERIRLDTAAGAPDLRLLCQKPEPLLAQRPESETRTDTGANAETATEAEAETETETARRSAAATTR